MKKNRIFLLAALLVVIGLIIWLSIDSSPAGNETIVVQVEQGDLVIDVTTTGELEAKESEKIMGPVNLRNVRIYRVTIEDIIPDGTIVDSGDYVASLDKTELANNIQDEKLELEKLETQLLQTRLDTTMQLRTARDELINLKYNLEERQIVVDQSIYEPPATQRQARIDLDKAERNYKQALENYQIKLQQAEANMQEVLTSIKKVEKRINEMEAVLDEFIVRAPKPGMVVYQRNWDGKKIGAGDQISAWDPVVAELPNLEKMISKTYVNEIDISKVQAGQAVEIGVDAFPDREYTGEVMEVANIGQQMRNSNAKVFEVLIDVNEYDSILRPAMTTKNRIITTVLDSVLYIPIECVQNNDSLSYVYTSRHKQQVITGKSNENRIVVLEGLDKKDEIYLIAPEDAEDMGYSLLDPELVKKYEKKQPKATPEKDTPPISFKEDRKDIERQGGRKGSKQGRPKR
ncbi:MAG: efflux RND transporter periplasmic adaptor subunit [Bacteroidales bacterium]|nr:efflux RND transporter periplasmic adaptor subunit [Bacteroidales bacterium]MCF8343691.1 efflux RND transporter periplasmic adaptor subunit [Bacteroidales bacterium]MCF8374750.1 efflux RND transporter periplasmic adaptor subunit [Bacteroidales bacterium]MCF8399846.1 efflux RND transporter periplasmic adaptor subunit [Bacteroidales bacterium]